MKNRCFVCKIHAKTQPIGLKKLGCKEINLCLKCNNDLQTSKVQSVKKDYTVFKLNKPIKTTN